MGLNLSTVSGAAPFPLSAILPAVLSSIADAVGGSADDPAGLATKIGSDPQAGAKLQDIESQHLEDLTAALDALKLQTDQNNEELHVENANAGTVFFAGWRPAFAWTIVMWANVILVRSVMGQKITPEFLSLWNPMWIAFGGMMGLRTAEKFGGVATEALKGILPKLKKLAPAAR